MNIKVDLKEYQKDRDRYIVIKDFYKIGSAVMGFNAEEDIRFRHLLCRCLLLGKRKDLQVVRMGGPECLYMYGEYGPYFVFDNDQDLIDICLIGDCPGYVNDLIPESPYVKSKEDRIKYRKLFYYFADNFTERDSLLIKDLKPCSVDYA